jgi:putative intracellular protease/amidase
MTRVLMVLTAADTLTLADGTQHPTGYWAEEVAASHRVLREAGFEVQLATPGGARPTVDPISLDERGGVAESEAAEFRAYLDRLAPELEAPLPIAAVNLAEFDAIYIPGGHGPMADLATDRHLGRLLSEANARHQLIAALCHGPAALLSAVREDGAFEFAGRRLTGFTDEEESTGGLGENTPYLVMSRLRELGAIPATGPAWSSVVVVDGNLVTGQNPQSSIDTASQVAAMLKD